MNRIKEIEARREVILSVMRSIRSMKKGSVAEQYQKVHHKGKQEPVLTQILHLIFEDALRPLSVRFSGCCIHRDQ